MHSYLVLFFVEDLYQRKSLVKLHSQALLHQKRFGLNAPWVEPAVVGVDARDWIARPRRAARPRRLAVNEHALDGQPRPVDPHELLLGPVKLERRLLKAGLGQRLVGRA